MARPPAAIRPPRAPAPRLALGALTGVLCLAANAPLATLAEDGDASEPRTFEDLGLTVQPPPLADLTYKGAVGEELVGWWSGRLDAIQVQVKLMVLPGPRSSFGVNDPSDVTDLVAPYVTKIEGDRFEQERLVTGPYGYAGYASLGSGPQMIGTKETAHCQVLAGILPERAYYLWIHAAPLPDAAQKEALEEWLVGAVRYDGEQRDPQWTEEEAEARWARDAPDDLLDELKNVIRTDHYIVFTNMPGKGTPRKFGKKMEEAYDAVQKLFPFQEVEGRALMPVFLFQTPEQYYQYYMKVAGISREGAAQSKGHAWRDYYATWYEAPNDPVHIHEATHQIFANRLRLSGGGSWFQEGIAEFVSEPEREIRNYAKGRAKRGTQTPFREFVQIQSMLYSADQDNVSGESSAGNNYTQAASIIAFLHDSKFGRDRFQEFVHAMGRVPRGDLEHINTVLRLVYGVDVDGLEAEWVDYWKRK